MNVDGWNREPTRSIPAESQPPAASTIAYHRLLAALLFWTTFDEGFLAPPIPTAVVRVSRHRTEHILEREHEQFTTSTRPRE